MKNPQIACKPRIRIMVGKEIALGPGKIDLLEAIHRRGSISSAAREMGLSYRRAWSMVDTMNRCFKEHLVTCAAGGKRGGGASLSGMGLRVAELYRAMEARARDASRAEWEQIQKTLKQKPDALK
ncbi:MAG: LysR family transcriptional regulator [Nitrospinae bacterium]|nr:LysR family transcriptional regulator [Nitrospinota bacterium]